MPKVTLFSERMAGTGHRWQGNGGGAFFGKPHERKFDEMAPSHEVSAPHDEANIPSSRKFRSESSKMR